MQDRKSLNRKIPLLKGLNKAGQGKTEQNFKTHIKQGSDQRPRPKYNQKYSHRQDTDGEGRQQKQR